MNEPRLVVPALDKQLFPTLGPEVCDFIEARLVFGPGDLLGRRVADVGLLDEVRAFIYRAYEVYPRGHDLEGRRRFKRAAFSRRKGFAKTELGAWIAIVEMDPEGPVRCDGFREVDGDWIPVGRPVTDPYIPVMATAEEQAELLGYGAIKAILEQCELGNEYDIGLDRIQHRAAPGRIEAVAGSPNARDGGRTTFEWFDETHRYVAARVKEAHGVMLENLPKRVIADAWALETTTMYGPGEMSIAEMTHLYAEAIRNGQVDDPRLLFDHRQAAETHDLSTKAGLRAAIIEASGDALSFTDVDSIMAGYLDPNADKETWRRLWLNQRRRRGSRWLPADAVEGRIVEGRMASDLAGEEIVLAFDGSYSRDSTALVGATVAEVPHAFVIRVWERPPHQPGWRTPVTEVEQAVDDAMEAYQVVEFAPDPPGWRSQIEAWEAKYGDVVVRFDTNQPSRMGPAADEFEQAIRGTPGEDGEDPPALTLDGHQALLRHIGNCVVKKRGPWLLPTKESDDSPLKIDLAIGAVIATSRARWRHHNRPTRSDPMVMFV